MSEGYARENELVSVESNVYDRAMDVGIALSIVTFVVGMLTFADAVPLGATGTELINFFGLLLAATAGGVGIVAVFSYANVVPVTSQRVRGVAFGLLVGLVGLTVAAVALPVSLATMLGLILLVEAGLLAAGGVASRLELVDTDPSRTAGLLAGLAFGVIGAITGAVIVGSLPGVPSAVVGVPLWLLGAVALGVGFGALTIGPREDLGSTLPPALILGVFGATIATAAIGVGWQWAPENLSGGFTGGSIIPLFVLFGSLLTSWSAAKCRADFGARGRQYGAFFVINLNAFLMVAVMVAIVTYVTVKGVSWAFHGFTIGALSLLVVLTPPLVLTIQYARAPAGTDEWHTAARQFFRVIPLAAVGSLATLLLGIFVTGTTFEVPYQYAILVDRSTVMLDTAVSVTPSLQVGNLLVIVSGALLFTYFLRRYGSLRDVGTEYEQLSSVRQGLPAAIGLLGLLSLVYIGIGPVLDGLPIGIGVATLGAVAVAALALAPLGPLVTGEGSLADRAHRNSQLLNVGLLGGVALLTAVVVFEWTAVSNPRLGPVAPVGVVAVIAALASTCAAGLASRARRATDDTLRHRILGDQVTLGLAAAAGYLTLIGLHVAATSEVPFVLGPIEIGIQGSLSWPAVLQGAIPLGEAPGGIYPAIVGTIWIVIGASLFAVPLGLGAAVFLTEYAEQGRFTEVVETATNALWSTPSIVFGLFGAAFLIPRLGDNLSLLAAQLTLSFMLLPLVVITSREAIKSVPDEYRDASAALGVDKWKTIRSVVIPAAMPGVVTGVILGVGRIAGETAPLILVLGSEINATNAIDVLGGFAFTTSPPFVTNDALLTSSAALPTQVWAIITAGVSGSASKGWATAFMLLVVVLSFYAVGITARTYFRRKINYE
ncbi:phosphate ABC transporter permease PstA [Halorientalis pallida]|uniref:Phosphate transport system permease protein PstA n=1 Tax=Halorientalis pallida TaxID=2479928 RepID=A0A498L5T0_9EURY|nr:phosphate ABC transporter permease PstA [Halorientalis pallida]RXK51632.1 phosphate ABC transporter permease PstA [Halorientalis pallida]